MFWLTRNPQTRRPLGLQSVELVRLYAIFELTRASSYELLSSTHTQNTAKCNVLFVTSLCRCWGRNRGRGWASVRGP